MSQKLLGGGLVHGARGVPCSKWAENCCMSLLKMGRSKGPEPSPASLQKRKYHRRHERQLDNKSMTRTRARLFNLLGPFEVQVWACVCVCVCFWVWQFIQVTSIACMKGWVRTWIRVQCRMFSCLLKKDTSACIALVQFLAYNVVCCSEINFIKFWLLMILHVVLFGQFGLGWLIWRKLRCDMHE